MIVAIIFVILFFIVPPGIFMMTRMLKEYAKANLFGRRRSATAIANQKAKEGLNKKASKRIKFTLRDPRKKPVPFRIIFFLIYIVGAVISFVGGMTGNWSLLLLSFLFAYGAILFSIITANRIVKEREAVMKRMLELKSSKMKLVNREKGALPNPEEEFKVLEWSEDLTSPVKMYIFLPTDFDILQVDGFMESFNLIFGKNGQWIADDTDEQYGGFDFNAGVAAIRTSTPLPQIAMWHERYLNPKDIHWSFFPLALGAENGVPVYNEELGITEHVLGFAVNGGQEKLSKKNGVVIGKEVTSSPQVLVAGGTGGGKSLNSSSKVLVIDEDSEGSHK